MNNSTLARKKQGGKTCWFHAALNGFLLSSVGRQFLRYILDTENVKEITKDICPMKSLDNRKLALQLIKGYLNEGISTSKENVNTFVKYNKNMNKGGTVNDQAKLYNTLFYKYKSFIKVGYLSNNNKKYKTSFEFNGPTNIINKKNLKNNNNYILSHSIITVQSNTYGHDMCGYKNIKGEYVIFDSGTGKDVDIDWSNFDTLQSNITKYVTKWYSNLSGVPLIITMLITWIDLNKVRKSKQNNAMAAYFRGLGKRNVNFRHSPSPIKLSSVRKSPIIGKLPPIRKTLVRLSPIRLSPSKSSSNLLSNITIKNINELIKNINNGVYNSNITDNKKRIPAKKKALNDKKKPIANVIQARNVFLKALS